MNQDEKPALRISRAALLLAVAAFALAGLGTLAARPAKDDQQKLITRLNYMTNSQQAGK